MTMSLTKSEHSCHSQFPSYSVHPGAFLDLQAGMLGAEELRVAYAASDLFVSASTCETLGNTVVEVWSPDEAFGFAQLAM